MKLIKFAAVIFLGMIWLANPNILYAESKDASIYKDGKNGYFSFVPPKSWKVEDYNDPRTKVGFNHPTERGVFIRFIVREAPGETFSDMKRSAEETAQQWRAKGVPCKVDNSEWLGVPATTISADIPGVGYTQLIKFLIAGLHFNIQYAAPNRDKFNKYLNDVTQSLNSIVVNKPSKLDSEKAKRQQTANIIRLAELANERGDKINACLILKDGLKEFPNSTEIKSKIEAFQCDKSDRN